MNTQEIRARKANMEEEQEGAETDETQEWERNDTLSDHERELRRELEAFHGQERNARDTEG